MEEGRKPKGMSFRDWVEGQITRAQRRGDFDNLPGAGKPLADLDTSDDPMAWIVAKLKRENLPISAILPPSLALAKEVEDLPDTLDKLRTEAAVRTHLQDLNDRILAAHRRPQEGPPLLVMKRDVEATVAAWWERKERRATG